MNKSRLQITNKECDGTFTRKVQKDIEILVNIKIKERKLIKKRRTVIV